MTVRFDDKFANALIRAYLKMDQNLREMDLVKNDPTTKNVMEMCRIAHQAQMPLLQSCMTDLGKPIPPTGGLRSTIGQTLHTALKTLPALQSPTAQALRSRLLAVKLDLIEAQGLAVSPNHHLIVELVLTEIDLLISKLTRMGKARGRQLT